MRTYFLSCEKYTNNSGPKQDKDKKEIRGASKFLLCVANKSTFLKQNSIGAETTSTSLFLRAK